MGVLQFFGGNIEYAMDFLGGMAAISIGIGFAVSASVAIWAIILSRRVRRLEMLFSRYNVSRAGLDTESQNGSIPLRTQEPHIRESQSRISSWWDWVPL